MSDVAIVPQQPHSVILRPVLNATQLIESHKEISTLITEGLEYGVDYGVIPGTGSNATLLKPGAERLVKAFGCTARYELVLSTTDHNFESSWVDKYGKGGKSKGLYSYLYRCVIEKNGAFGGDGQGQASTNESKYRNRPNDCENTVIKMAQKRALVAAVLNTFGLSGRFTQDIEDIVEVVPAIPEKPEIYEETPAQKRHFAELAYGLGLTDKEKLKKASTLCAGLETRNLRAAISEYITDIQGVTQ